jgi:cytoskeletal protein RodZ
MYIYICMCVYHMQCLSRNSRFIKLGNANQIILNAIHRLRHSNTNFAPPTATPTSSSSSSDTSLNGSASSRRKRGDSTTSTAATTGLTTTYDTAKEMPSPSSPSSSASSTPISRSPYPEAAALATELGVPVAKVGE